MKDRNNSVNYKKAIQEISKMSVGTKFTMDGIFDIMGNKDAAKNRTFKAKYQVIRFLIKKLANAGIILSPVKKYPANPKSKIIGYKITKNNYGSISMDDLEQICTPAIPNSIVESKAFDKLGKQNANLFRENESLKKEILNLKEIEKQLNYELAIARQNADDWKEVAEGLMRIHANDERINAVAI